jgi:predicted thioesterase
MKTPLNEVKAEVFSIVNSTNTAVAAQSGNLQVFGTPYMIALMEKATCMAIADHLEEGETTVGTNIAVSHMQASAVGSIVTATAVLDEIDGRKLTFNVTAKEANGTTIGEGRIERFVVISDKFMKKVETK